MFRMFLMAAAAVAILSGPVQAGGGGKQDSNIRVNNHTDVEILVVVNPDDEWLEGVWDEQEFLNRAQSIPAKGNRLFKVQQGTHTVLIVDPEGPWAQVRNVTVKRRQTAIIHVRDSDDWVFVGNNN